MTIAHNVDITNTVPTCRSAQPVTIWGCLMNGPDEGPCVVNRTVPAVAEALALAATLDPGEWEGIAVVIRPAR